MSSFVLCATISFPENSSPGVLIDCPPGVKTISAFVGAVITVPTTDKSPTAETVIPVKDEPSPAKLVAVNVPSTSKLSLMFITLESSLEIDVPLNFKAPAVTNPVPEAVKIRSSLVLVARISFPSTIIPLASNGEL